MTDQPKQDPKIIVDGDWKSQVEAEKEELRKNQGDESAAAEPADASDEETVELPPASFPMLVSMLATQALAALGQFAEPGQDEPIVNLAHAKHHIDTLAVLEAKTQGNLDDDEAKMLTDVLYQLRMAFVERKSGTPSSNA